jgi:predicted RNase H-like HicB family nuclease
MKTTTSLATAIRYDAMTWREGDAIVAHAWPLDVATSGDSEEHALRMLDEAVRGFLEATRDMGTLDDILEELGYQLQGDALVPPQVRHTEAVSKLTL